MRAAEQLLDIPFIDWTPTGHAGEVSARFREVALYGGSAGGGKSVAVLMAALMFVDVPEYRAVIIRRYLTDLLQPGGLLDLTHQLLGDDVRWRRDANTFVFASGGR